MKTTGTRTSMFKIPVCNIFKQKLHNDQVCYETDLGKLKNKEIDNFSNQLNIGLVLLLDYNEDRQIYFPTKKTSMVSKEQDKLFNYNDNNPALIYFNSIS